MFYIIVNDDDKEKVIASSNGTPRKFPKRKKAQNFIDGREYLEEKSPRIVTEIEWQESYKTKYYFKVDI